MLTCQRHLFTIPEDVAYLNTAYMSPQLKSVEEAGFQAVARKGKPWTILVDDFYDPVTHLKILFNQLIEGENPQRVALVPSVSYGIATVAKNLSLSEGDEIVVLQEQFPSNILAWQRLARETGARIITVAAPESGPERSKAWNRRLLEVIGPQTRLVAMGHVHWADGTLFDLAAVREKSRHHDAFLVLDLTQSLGALPFSVRKYQPDALICGGYKWLLGPYSLSLAYFGPAFDDGVPLEEGWYNRLGSNNFGGLVEYQEQYEPLANRYSMGESSNFVLVPMLSKALEQILAWGVENIAGYSRSITAEFVSWVNQAGLHLSEGPDRTHHLLGLMLPDGLSLRKLKENLAAQNIFVSTRGSSMRISAHVYNKPAEFSRLAAVLEEQLSLASAQR